MPDFGYHIDTSARPQQEERAFRWSSIFAILLVLAIVLGLGSQIPDPERDYARACKSVGLSYWNTGPIGPRCQDKQGNHYEIPAH